MRIAVLNLDIEGKEDNQDKLIYVIADVLRSQGHEVIHLHGTSRKVPADILFLHVDLSVVPESYRAFAADYPVVINGNIPDIRKSAYSLNRVLKSDGWTGAVIVKSDHNYGGQPEKIRTLDRIDKNLFLRLLKKVNQSVAYRWAGGEELPFKSYPVFDSKDGVPEEWWSSENLIVEKFVPERDGDFYVLRKYCCLGSRQLVLRSWGRDPIVSTKTQEGSETLENEIPPELIEFRRRMKLDYGKIDYGMVDGNCVIYDVNKTIGTPRQHSPKVRQFAEYLAAGLEDPPFV